MDGRQARVFKGIFERVSNRPSGSSAIDYYREGPRPGPQAAATEPADSHPIRIPQGQGRPAVGHRRSVTGPVRSVRHGAPGAGARELVKTPA